ncbi:MAG: hypothetical protein RJQ09_11550 [Cyclobacteriaceae bacterium]
MRIVLVICMTLFWACGANRTEILRSKMNAYLEAKALADGSHHQFVADTFKTWFEDRQGKPIIRIKGEASKGPWAEWDEVFHSKSTLKGGLKIDQEDDAVTGIFFESNEFYELIGKPPTETTRTFWFDKEDKLAEVLIIWKPDQPESDEFLKPIVEWAQMHDSVTLNEIYPKGKIKPSQENAVKWREMIKRYKDYSLLR